MPHWVNSNPIGTMKVLQSILERMGGVQVNFAKWPKKEKTQKDEPKDVAKIREGYAFIRIKGPKSNNANQFQEWADVEVSTPDSPIFGWPEGKVKEALNNLLRGRSTAKTLDFNAFSYKDMEPWFFKDFFE